MCTTQPLHRFLRSACLAAALLLLLVGCEKEAAESVPPNDPAPEATASAPLPDESLYQLAAVWTNQEGELFALAQLRGRPVLLSMVYTRCGYACPMIVRDMKRIAGTLPDELQEDLQYVLVSLDTEHDTPEALATFAKMHRLDPQHWTLLHGGVADVQMLAALLGTRYKQEPGGGFSHSNLVTLLTAEGEIAHRQEGLGTDPAAAGAAIRKLGTAGVTLAARR